MHMKMLTSWLNVFFFFPQENLWIGGQWELFCMSFLLDAHLFLETLLRSYFHKSSMVINCIFLAMSSHLYKC